PRLFSAIRRLLSALFCSRTHPPPPEIYTLSLHDALPICLRRPRGRAQVEHADRAHHVDADGGEAGPDDLAALGGLHRGLQLGHQDRKSTRLNSSHGSISYAVFCLKKKTKTE